MAERSTEILVGGAVLAVAAGFLFYAGQVAGLGGGDAGRATYTASFRSVEGIGVGTDVRMAGVKVGSVTALQLNPETFRAETVVTVDERIALPADTAIVVASEGLLGGSFVELVPGGAPDNIEPGTEIYDTQSAISLITLLLRFVGGDGEGERAMIRLLALLASLAAPAAAQDSSAVLIVPPEDDGTLILPEPEADGDSLLAPDLDLNFVPGLGAVEEAPRIVALIGQGALLRGLDKLSGSVEDLELAPGQSVGFGSLQVTLGECRYPEDNPSGDAYAYLVIRNAGEEVPVFEGWMIASSPALNAMDHARYDVWVLRCRIS